MDDNLKHYTPPPVTGYRTLTSLDVALMNEVKAAEAAYLAVVERVVEHVEDAYQRAYDSHEMGEVTRIVAANPRRWAQIGRTHVEQATMAVCRAIAQPGRS